MRKFAFLAAFLVVPVAVQAGDLSATCNFGLNTQVVVARPQVVVARPQVVVARPQVVVVQVQRPRARPQRPGLIRRVLKRVF